MAPPADVKERLKASYDAMAPEYNAWTAERHNSLRLKYLDKLLELCPQLLADAATTTTTTTTAGRRAPHVVELGCGAGLPVLSTLMQKNKDLTATALDISDTQIQLAKENLKDFGPRATFIAGDMVQATSDTAPSSCTAVIALYSIIHLSQEEQALMIRRVAGFLEDGGCFLACFGKDELEGAVMEKWLHEEGWMFFSGLGVDGTVKGLEGAGLQIEVKEVEEGPQGSFLWIIARK